MDDQWYTAVLEEYKSLRSEAVTARDAQLLVLRLSVPLLAALIGLGVTLKSEGLIGGFLLSIAVPLIVILTFELWIGEIQRSIRAGAVVAAIEHRLAGLFADSELGPPMGWEIWLRKPVGSWGKKYSSQQERDSIIRALVISGFLLIIAIGSFALGLHFLWHEKYETLTYVTAGVLGGALVLLGVRIRVAVRGLVERNQAPKREELWPLPDLRDREMRP